MSYVQTGEMLLWLNLITSKYVRNIKQQVRIPIEPCHDTKMCFFQMARELDTVDKNKTGKGN